VRPGRGDYPGMLPPANRWGRHGRSGATEGWTAMTYGTRRRWWRTAAALLAPVLLLTGCIEDGARPQEPLSQASPGSAAEIRLGDIFVGSSALAARAGLYVCGNRVVASAPAGGIEADSFAVFDMQTKRGEITEVRLPPGVRANARWLLTTECVDDGGRPFVSVAYQQMPLSPLGGGGVRAAYTLDGELMWMRRDLNQPARVIDDLLVLGGAAEQPQSAVDLRTGRTVATFDPSILARTVVSGNRMVVRGLTGPAVLTTLTGERIARLRQASSFIADGGLLFGITPAELPDTGRSAGTGAGEGFTDASPSPSPTDNAVPQVGSGLFRGEVQAYSLRTGEPVWRLGIAPDPLGVPTVEPTSGVVVVVDVAGVAHGIDPRTGRQLWRAPTELDNPRVTAGSGMVLFDNLGDRFQKLLDARTGLPLPEPENPIVDLQAPGAVLLVDSSAAFVGARELRTPPTSTDEPTF
jgi:outer membrane protein assembly factor BamB